ncbi:hypothetical protein AVEN_79578-1 [Araneus ventricosus]|uniref:Secreted protein n=1 Tax=Araneus ventricosus TaxID=182803 RepID=A0A4Y2RSQ5_ARAVE|nr:hypothetical protein AVEN_79578-1 [Araneus ventricosus]
MQTPGLRLCGICFFALLRPPAFVVSFLSGHTKKRLLRPAVKDARVIFRGRTDTQNERPFQNAAIGFLISPSSTRDFLERSKLNLHSTIASRNLNFLQFLREPSHSLPKGCGGLVVVSRLRHQKVAC